MECVKIENLSFSYPNKKNKALNEINLSINQGEFITVMGKSGCGKTTLLRLLKPPVAPAGEIGGNIEIFGKKLNELTDIEQIFKIGFVMQSPENQIVTDKVWHELAFGLEGMGVKNEEIRARVAETASFFGIQNWFHKKTAELSGGQKQLLSLASVMTTSPDILVLDEPTSRLDPIASQEFFGILKKINRELGTTVILCEHRLEELFSLSDKIIVMENGKIISCENPKKTGEALKKSKNDMYFALPTAMRIYGALENENDFPLNVKEGKEWFLKYAKNNAVKPALKNDTKTINESKEKPIVEVKEACFRYERNENDIIKNLNLQVFKGELFAVVGGNGTGKTTALSLISGLNKPYRGKITINNKKLDEIPELYTGLLGVLPQNPQTLFVKKSVELELLDMLENEKITEEEKANKVNEVACLCQIKHLFEQHPYDLSGGEQQRVALAKILLKNPEILLLDEPTQGMDAYFKGIFAGILQKLKKYGVTVIMVSHDLEFCAKYADRCGLFFDGSVISCDTPRSFFKNNMFYTTTANRIAKNIIPDAVTAEDVIFACGKNNENFEFKQEKKLDLDDVFFSKNKEIQKSEKTEKNKRNERKKISIKKICLSFVCVILFAITFFLQNRINSGNAKAFVQILTIFEATGIFLPFLSSENLEITKKTKAKEGITKISAKQRKQKFLSAILTLTAIIITVFAGTYFFQGRKYYFISLLIILETSVPVIIGFEKRRPKTRELVIVSVLSAVAAAGREAFVALPQFKPVMAIVIITGIVFGGEAGFLTGALSAFLSNFMFGQGPWTPWQMISFGFVGFLTSLIFEKSNLLTTKLSLCVFGGASTFFIYGIINNVATVIMYQQNPTFAMFVSSCVTGIPFDLVHAVSTVFFLWLASEPFIEKLERIKTKYGI